MTATDTMMGFTKSMDELLFCLRSFFFFPALVYPPYGNSHSRNFATPRGLGVKRTFAMPISWKSPIKVLGDITQNFVNFFSAAQVQMAASLPNANGNQKSKTTVYYGNVCSMFGWTLIGCLIKSGGEKYTLPTFRHGCLLDLTTARRASSASHWPSPPWYRHHSTGFAKAMTTPV